jgi:hypothetical protein
MVSFVSLKLNHITNKMPVTAQILGVIQPMKTCINIKPYILLTRLSLLSPIGRIYKTI